MVRGVLQATNRYLKNENRTGTCPPKQYQKANLQNNANFTGINQRQSQVGTNCDVIKKENFIIVLHIYI